MRLIFCHHFRIETDTSSEILKLTGAYVAGHYDNGVLEIDLTPERIGETPFVHHLKQKVEHIRMGFFNLIKKHYGIRTSPYFLGKLSSLLISHISGRCSHKAGHRKFLHKLTHIHTDQ